MGNAAAAQGGGLFITLAGTSNHSISIRTTTYIRNEGHLSAGAIFVGFSNPGSLTRLYSIAVQDATFAGNLAPIGGAVFLLINGTLLKKVYSTKVYMRSWQDLAHVIKIKFSGKSCACI